MYSHFFDHLVKFLVTFVFTQMQGDSIKAVLKPADLQTNMFAFVYTTKILRRWAGCKIVRGRFKVRSRFVWRQSSRSCSISWKFGRWGGRSEMFVWWNQFLTNLSFICARYHVFGDPGFDCREYSAAFTYDNCIHQVIKLEMPLYAGQDHIGCIVALTSLW